MAQLTRVLIVDDKPENLYLLRVLLSSKGYEVSEASNGEEALKIARQSIPNIIVSDILMPVMDGFSLCRQWQIDPQLCSIPFVFYTATYTEAKDKDFALNLGAQLFLVKPQEPQVFLSEIHNVLEEDRCAAVPDTVVGDELEGEEYYRQYSVRLVNKLEDKLKEIEQKNNLLARKKEDLLAANTRLENQNKLLEEEVKQNKRINNELFQSKKTIEKNERELSLILNNLLEGVFLLDHDFNIVKHNHAAEIIFGYSAVDLKGLNLKGLVPDLSPLSDVMAENKYQAKHKNNTPLVIQLSIIKSPVIDNEQFICSCLDITYQQQQEEQLRRSQKMQALGKLTGGISHDLNNLLCIMLGFTELLDESLQGPPTLTNYVLRINQAGERATKLISKLLAFSRKNAVDAQLVNINQLIIEQRHMLEKAITVSVKLELDLEENLWFVYIDPGSLEDAILNMCINAMHAMPDGGTLKISSKNKKISANTQRPLNITEGEYVVLSLSDNGVGMSQETQQKIFDPFYTTKGENGTGLGMSQVYGFTQQSKAYIQVQSELGKGSLIELYFLRKKESLAIDKTMSSMSQKNNQQYAGSAHILVVDDEPGIRNLTKEMLSRQGYQVSTAESVTKALKALQENTFDLLITDMLMPEMNGSQLIHLVREQFADIKIMIMSGFNNDEDKLTDNALSSYPQLQKPFNSAALLKMVCHVLDGDN